MKIWNSKFLKQMIIVITLVFVIFNGIAPSKVYATKSQEGVVWNILEKKVNNAKKATALGLVSSTSLSGEKDWFSIDNIPGNLLREFINIVIGLADAGMALMQVTMLGDWRFWGSTFISYYNDNLEDTSSWLYADQNDVNALENGDTSNARGSMLIYASDAGLRGGLFDDWNVPNLLYSPENIFANKIAALDANYINPHQYTAVNDSNESEEEATSFAESISPTIASWYRAFRNIAIVGLLSVLVYIGIRILIGTVAEKAKYKERLTDWFVALCLVFFMHFIMAGIMMISEKITDLFSNSINSGIIVAVDDGTIFRTNLMGYIRFAAQSDSWTEALGYGIMYLILVGITLRFTFIYLKRALYLAFFTMISPLVAITYPIDKAGDSKAQAFNMWIKEYFINAILQPMHLILYSALVGAAMTLVVQNPIYGIVALLFISTAEKWVKKMFKMDQAALTATSLGDVAVLGSMLNMGKNIAGGIMKTAVLVGATVATGGAAAPVTLKGLGSTAAGAAKDAAEGISAAAEGTPTAAEGTALDVGKGNGVEDIVQQIEINQLEEKIANAPMVDDKETKIARQRLAELQAKLQTSRDNNSNNQELPKEKTDKQRVQEIHTANVNTIGEKAPSPEALGGENIEDVSGIEKTSVKTINANEKEKTKEKTLDAPKSEEEQKDSTQSSYYKKQLQDRIIKSLTDKDPKEELIDMGIKGVTGAAGALVGAPAGFFAAGLTGDSKSILAGTMGGASVGAGIADFAISTGNTTFNNNVKVLVKKGELTDENIIKNTAQLAQTNHWSQSKMLLIGKLAEAYPELAKDKKSQDEIKKIFEKQGVAQAKWNEGIQNIISVQAKNDVTQKKKENKAQKKLENWK